MEITSNVKESCSASDSASFFRLHFKEPVKPKATKSVAYTPHQQWMLSHLLSKGQSSLPHHKPVGL